MVQTIMRAARLHDRQGRFQVDEVPYPEVRELDVVVDVKAACVLPNLPNVIRNFETWFPQNPLPKLPAICGLDSAGVVAEVGSRVRDDIKVGDRVYVNPGLSCGSCRACQSGVETNCIAYTFMGYFGFGPGSARTFEEYPYGGFGEFLTAPARNIVKLPDSVSFEQATRFGYTGTAFSGFRKANLSPGQTVLVDGGTGVLGVGAVISALALGASKVLATGRNRELLKHLRSIAPDRIVTFGMEEDIEAAALAETDGYGIDVVMQCLGAMAPPEQGIRTFRALRKGGCFVSTGGVHTTVPIDPNDLMTNQKSLIGSKWFTTNEGQIMADLAGIGVLNMSVFETQAFPMDQVEDALAALDRRKGGFTNIVIAQ